MTTPSYFDAYENLAMTRDGNGVLTVRFHTDGGPIVFTGRTHEDFPRALEDIALRTAISDHEADAREGAQAFREKRAPVFEPPGPFPEE